jgi:DNA replication initiation complex subunit (GINS family)
MSEISITYDLLFDILRMEKSRDELQKIDEKFYINVVDYINSKESIISNPNTPISERELTRIQLGNIRKLLMELYDRREKKIINLSIYKIKTSSGMINTEGLLDDERILFDSLYSYLSRYRLLTINNILEGKFSKPEQLNSASSTANTLANNSIIGNSGRISVGNIIDNTSQTSDYASGDDIIKSVRFIKPVPRFLGPELEIYGPFEENDIASLPSKIARILIGKQRAEEMNTE